MTNIGEEGRKAIDKGLKAKLNITEEQSESDSAKIKCRKVDANEVLHPTPLHPAPPRPPTPHHSTSPHPTHPTLPPCQASSGGKKRKRKASKNIVSYLGWEWDASKRWDIECVLGKMVAEKGVVVPGRTGVKPGTLLYKVLWADFPPEIATWEDEDTVHDDTSLTRMRQG